MGECTWVVCTHHVHIVLYKELGVLRFLYPWVLELKPRDGCIRRAPVSAV